VKDVSFDIRPGEFVGYIGPNGAGKSTTVKMLTGILHPTSGDVSVNGLSPQRQRQQLAYQIGVVFGQRTQLWWDLPTIDSFDILSAMYDVDRTVYQDFLKQFDDLLGLGEFLDTPVRRLSLGQRMRAELAASLIHSPNVLFLDEPTIGLDVVAKGRIRDFLKKLSSETGVTILLTTHDLRDIEELCDRVIMINHGSLIYDGTLQSLRSHAGLPTILEVKYASLPAGLEAGGYVGPGGELLDAPANGCWEIVSVAGAGGNNGDAVFGRNKRRVTGRADHRRHHQESLGDPVAKAFISIVAYDPAGSVKVMTTSLSLGFSVSTLAARSPKPSGMTNALRLNDLK
jgi:ABC-2 type transport system ATP-binding protein